MLNSHSWFSWYYLQEESITIRKRQYFEWFMCNHFYTIKLHFHKKTKGNSVAHLIYRERKHWAGRKGNKARFISIRWDGRCKRNANWSDLMMRPLHVEHSQNFLVARVHKFLISLYVQLKIQNYIKYTVNMHARMVSLKLLEPFELISFL